jgi:dynein heavy chain
MDGAGAQGGRVPWDDLKYIFGDIMYGGHIVDDWDRRFCSAYLDSLMQDSLLDEAEMFPFIEGKNISFKSPAGLSSHEKFLEYIETELPPETPLAFAMHPNAEIDFRTTQCRNLFAQLTELQPKGSGGSAEGGGANDKVVEFISRVNDEAQLENCKFNIDDIAGKLNEETRGPYQNAFMQECECMNVLIKVIVASLVDIVLAFKGELTMSEKMENLMKDINLNKVPAGWEKFAFPSMRGLGSWLDNIKQRIE